MERQGVIRGYRAELDEDADRRSAGTVLMVYLRGEKIMPRRLLAALKDTPEVTGCYWISGEADLFVILSVMTRERLQEICEPLWQLGEVRIQTLTVLKTEIE